MKYTLTIETAVVEAQYEPNVGGWELTRGPQELGFIQMPEHVKPGWIKGEARRLLAGGKNEVSADELLPHLRWANRNRIIHIGRASGILSSFHPNLQESVMRPIAQSIAELIRLGGLRLARQSFPDFVL